MDQCEDAFVFMWEEAIFFPRLVHRVGSVTLCQGASLEFMGQELSLTNLAFFAPQRL